MFFKSNYFYIKSKARLLFLDKLFIIKIMKLSKTIKFRHNTRGKQ